MPRFQTETELPLNDTMKELGMPTAFTMGAEFPYFGNRDVFISQMFQKAKIELDEEGTAAAAATADILEPRAAMPQEPISFNFDHASHHGITICTALLVSPHTFFPSVFL